MKNQTKICFVILIMSSIIISGCIEGYIELSDGTKVYGDYDKIKIIDYSIGKNDTCYFINITVKNIKAHTDISIRANFYDSNNNLLYGNGNSVGRTNDTDIYPNQIFYFKIIGDEYFNKIDHITLKIWVDPEL